MGSLGSKLLRFSAVGAAGTKAYKKAFGLGGGNQVSTTASDTYAGIIRDQWADYTNRFAPWENKLVSMATSNEDNQLSEQRASNAVGNSFNTSKGILSRDRSRLGISLTPEEQADESRLGAGLQAAANNSAVLKARLHAQDRDNQMLSGGGGLNINSATEGRILR